MKHKSKFLFKILIILVLSTILFSPLIHGFSVSPLKIQKIVKPGATISDYILVEGGNKAQQIKIYCNDWYMNADGKAIFVETESKKVQRSCIPWITSIVPQQFTIQPDQTRIVKLTIKVPKKWTNSKSTAGLYHGMIFTESAPAPIKTDDKKVNGRIVRLKAKLRFGTNIEVLVNNNLNQKGIVSDLKISGDNKSLELYTSFKNTGNVKLQFSGYVDLRNENGKSIEKKTISKQKVIPDNLRKVKTSFENSLSPGQYSILSVIDYGGKNLVAGEQVFKIKKDGKIVTSIWE